MQKEERRYPYTTLLFSELALHQQSLLTVPVRMIGLEQVPSDVWNIYLTPCLDRRDWNAVRVACKPFYQLTESRVIIPPWPQRCYGGKATSIASFSISFDGEYMAVGSMVGSIEVWSRSKGRISRLHKKESLKTSSSCMRNRSSLSTSCEMRRSQPVGGILKFSPVDYTLASGQENRIFLQHVSDTVDHRELGNLCGMLEIQCQHGTIYEVTYLGFSQDATLLMARYGKMAYIWRKNSLDQCTTAEFFNYTLIHTLPLSSSRCPITLSISMTFLAVTDASSSGNKGTIDVWNMRNIQPGMHRVDPDTSNCCNKIVAHPKQVIRGLEFVACNDGGGTMDDKTHVLVSATLQGQIKFWQYDSHPASQKDDYDATSRSPYHCTRTFQVAGKIFSLALFVPSGCPQDNFSMCLAVGQSRGQVRAWKLNVGIVESACVKKRMEPKSAVTSGSAASNKSNHNETSSKTHRSSNDVRQEFLSVEVGEHVHHDNIKLLSFTPDGRDLVASRAYDARIWFHTVRCW
jgi:WD40 repeat protein